MSTYSALLKMPQWQRKRLEIMSRDSFVCVACGADDKMLNVHHKRYVRSAQPWEYDGADLETLCEDCHETRHWPGDINVARLDVDSLRGLLAFAIERENKAETDRERRYMAAKQSQAWRELFKRKAADAVV